MFTLRSSLCAAIAIAACLAFAPTASAAVKFDSSFGVNGRGAPVYDWDSAYMEIWDADVTPAGGPIIVGAQSEFDRNWAMQVFRRDGQPDTRFGKHGNVKLPRSIRRVVDYQAAQNVMVQPDGSILVAGRANVFNATDRRRCRCKGTKYGWAVIRFRSDGRLDRRYGNNGVALLRGISLPIGGQWDVGGGDASVYSMEPDQRGGAILYGNSSQALSHKPSDISHSAVIVRVDRSGQQDRTFGRGGRIIEKGVEYKIDPSTMGIRRDGAIVTIRESERGRTQGWRFALIRRYDSNGRPLRGRGMNRPYQRVRVPITGGDDYSLFAAHVSASGAIMFGPGDSTGKKIFNFMALRPDGKRDRRFGGDGIHRFTVSRPDLGRVMNTSWVPSGNSGIYRMMLDFEGAREIDSHRAVLSFDRLGRLSSLGGGSGLEVLDYGGRQIGIYEVFMTVGKRTAYMIDSDVHADVTELNVVSKLKFSK